MYKRGKAWTYVADAGRDPNTGKRRQRSKGGFSTRKAAEAAMREFLHARESGQLTEHSSATLAEYLEQWLANIEANARKTTFNGYRNDISRIVRVLGNVRLQELTPMQLESAYADMVKHGSMTGGALSPKTVYNAHSTLRRALNDAVRLGILIRNPVTAARSPKWTKPDIATWTAPQLSEFLAGIEDDPLQAAYVLIATTGMRRGEAMGLRWQDVDLDAAFVRIRQTLTTVNDELVFDTTKTNKSRRRISLDPATVASLRSHRARQAQDRLLVGDAWDDSNDLVFTNPDGTPVHPDRWTRQFKRHVKDLGLPELRGPHSLRHTWATLALEAGVHPKIVSERLGHSTIAITLDTYSHVVEGMDADAANTVADQIFKQAES
ncbi:MAG: site-specific integrase [Hyphomicrobiales bacterium]|nr:site-specific integrase [Hyphomicrobiales bacterium]